MGGLALVIYESDLQLTLLLSRLLKLHLFLKNFIKDLFLKICCQNMYNLKYFNIMCRYFLRMIIFFKRDLSIPAGVKFKCGQSNLADLKILAYTKFQNMIQFTKNKLCHETNDMTDILERFLMISSSKHQGTE